MDQARQLLTEKDRSLVESLVYDPSLPPKFNAIGCYLMWDDELPFGITPDGLDFLGNLWTARASLYHGYQLPEFFDPPYFYEIWNQAVADNLRWPGFQRLTLSNEAKAYLQEQLNDDDPFE